MMNPFLNARRQLRNGWWVLIFFALMAVMLIPAIVLTRRQGDAVPIGAQLAIVAIATCICQLLRRRPITEVTGRIDHSWLAQLFAGCALGAVLMLIPALFLRVFGYVTWTSSGASLTAILAAVPLVIAVAATEELIFRGFLFQRAIDGIGPVLAQLMLAAYFVLTHARTLATAGEVRYVAGTNIFIASLLFGFAFLRTKRLALPFGIHFAANFTQGNLLGFGVSGIDEAGLLVPARGTSADWITGGAFGLEGSLPGLITVVAMTLLVFRWGRNVPAAAMPSSAREIA